MSVMSSTGHSRPQCLRVWECARKLWETLRRSSQNLAIGASQRMLLENTVKRSQSQSRSQSIRYFCPADGVTDALEESKTGTTKSWFRFVCACVDENEKMAAAIDHFHCSLECALEKLGKAELSLKEAQYEALKNVVFDRRDTMCVLPTGYGKSLIYQLLPRTFDYFLSSDVENSSIIVVSPLNALMQDQISKLKRAP